MQARGFGLSASIGRRAVMFVQIGDDGRVRIQDGRRRWIDGRNLVWTVVPGGPFRTRNMALAMAKRIGTDD